MTCEQRRDSILLYAADALDPAERREIAAHLDSGCPLCAAALAEADATIGCLALSLEPVEPPRVVRDRLIARARADLAPEEVPQPPTVSAPRPPAVLGGALRPAVWFGAGLAAAAVAAFLLYLAINEPLKKQVADLSRRVASLQNEVVDLRGDLNRSTDTLHLMESPGVQLVNLKPTEAGPGTSGRIFWDRPRGLWHLRASGLKPLVAGRTYELWFITADQKPVRAQTFDVGPDGEGGLTVAVPRTLGPLALAAITEEPAGGSDAPTSKPLLAGSVSQ